MARSEQERNKEGKRTPRTSFWLQIQGLVSQPLSLSTFLTTQNLGYWASQAAHWLKESIHLPVQETQEMHVPSLGQEDPLEEEMVTCSSILAWRIPWTEDAGGL